MAGSGGRLTLVVNANGAVVAIIVALATTGRRWRVVVEFTLACGPTGSQARRNRVDARGAIAFQHTDVARRAIAVGEAFRLNGQTLADGVAGHLATRDFIHAGRAPLFQHTFVCRRALIVRKALGFRGRRRRLRLANPGAKTLLAGPLTNTQHVRQPLAVSRGDTNRFLRRSRNTGYVVISGHHNKERHGHRHQKYSLYMPHRFASLTVEPAYYNLTCKQVTSSSNFLAGTDEP